MYKKGDGFHHPPIFCFADTPEGTREIKESASSSRRRAGVHRTPAYNGSSPFRCTITDTVIDTIVSITVSVFYAYFTEITVKWAILLTLQRIYSLCFLDMVVLPSVPCLYPPHIVFLIR